MSHPCLLQLPNSLSHPGPYSGVRVTRSLVLCICFVYHYLSFFDCGFWLCLWYLQTFHILDLGKIWHFYVDNFCVPTIKYIICIIFKIIVFFIITLFARLYVIVGILLTIGKHLHYWIISISEEAWVFIYTLARNISLKRLTKWALMNLC